VGALDRLDAALGAIGLHRLILGIGVGGEHVDGDYRRHAELVDVLDVAAEVVQSLLDRFDILVAEIVLCHATMHLECANGGDDDRRGRSQASLAAFDVEELLGAEIGAEAGFRDDVVGQFQGGPGGQHRIAAMRDVGEGTAMHKGRIVLQRLNQIGLSASLSSTVMAPAASISLAVTGLRSRV
jgi:hypothetical protein